MAQSEDERRERQRIWAKDKRAKLRAERDAERRESRADAVANAPRTQRDALEASIVAAKWLRPSDGATMSLARALAEELDYADHMGDDALSLRIAGRFTTLLGLLGLTPVVRMKFELRSAQLAARTASEGVEPAPPASAAASLPANVSTLKRPAKSSEKGGRSDG